MSRVFVSEGTGAMIYVFSNDHCPPHLHARHRGDEWVARVRFSYLNGAVELLSVEPLKHTPPQRVIKRLLEEVRAQLSACRRAWWDTQRTVCLDDQWARIAADGSIEPLVEKTPEARRIAEAGYFDEAQRLWVRFYDGTITEVRVTT
jgi:hypothetical protein